MGPPAPTFKRDASGTATPTHRPDAPRARERWAVPSAPTTAHTTATGEPSPSRSALVETVEWASPTSIRARSRPSNLHAYLRSSPSFPASAAASPRPLRRQAAANGNGGGGSSVSSGGSTGAASPRKTRAGRVRSQSSRATQTSTTDFLIHSNVDDSTTTVSLGVYGNVARMGMETVNFLMGALEERRQHLLHNDNDLQLNDPRDASLSSEPQGVQHTNENITSDGSAGDNERPAMNHTRASSQSALDDDDAARGRVRSRSYEALAKLEHILETRHQQLMHDGALDGPMALSFHGPPGSDLTKEIRKLQQSFLMEARGQR